MQKHLRSLSFSFKRYLRFDRTADHLSNLSWQKQIQKKLASIRNEHSTKSEENLAAALPNNERRGYLFELQQELRTYNHQQKKGL
jgi:hypothetical protein